MLERGHIVSAPVQAAQLVILFCIIHNMSTKSTNGNGVERITSKKQCLRHVHYYHL